MQLIHKVVLLVWLVVVGTTSVHGQFSSPDPIDVIQTGPFTVEISWRDNSVGEAGYLIEKKVFDGAWSAIFEVPPTITTIQDAVVPPDVDVSYRVSTILADETLLSSQVVTIRTLPEDTNLRLNGDIELIFEETNNQLGDITGYNFVRKVVGLIPTPEDVEATLRASIQPGRIGAGDLYWDNPINWTGPNGVFVLANGVGAVKTVLTSGGSISAPFRVVTALDEALTDLGPTEDGSLSLNLITIELGEFYDFKVPIPVPIRFRYAVEIPDGASVILNQPAVLRSLAISGAGSLSGDPRMVVQETLTNQGQLTNLGGSVGWFQNSGTATVTASLNIHERLLNPGLLNLLSGELNLMMQTQNHGTFQHLGGSLNGAGGLENLGRYDWAGGTIGSSAGEDPSFHLVNSSADFRITGSATKRLVANAVVENNGIIHHSTVGSVELKDGAAIENRNGAIYNLIGDGIIKTASILGVSWVADFINRGQVRKTLPGDFEFGTSGDDYLQFHSLGGQIDVVEGAIILNNGGSLDSSSVQIDQQADFHIASPSSSPIEFRGDIHLGGGGRVTISGSAVGRGHARLLDMGEGLQVIHSGSLAVTDHDTLVLALENLVQTGGSIGGDGTIINEGAFDWRGGFISGTAFTNRSNELSITQSNAQVTQRINGRFTNEGSIDHRDQATVHFFDGATLRNCAGATYRFVSGGSLGAFDRYSDGTGIFENSGILKKDGDGTATVGTPNNDLVKLLNLGGRIEVYDGVLITQSGGQLQDSTILCENSGILQFANTNADGRMMISGTNLCVGTGTLALSGWLDAVGDSVLKGFDETGLVIHSGTLTAMDADSLVLRVGSFSHTGGSIGGDGTIINEGGFDWRGGFISGTAFTNRSNELSITQSNAQVTQRINGRFTNEGSIDHRDQATVHFFDGATLRNCAGATYRFVSGGSLGAFDRYSDGTGIFENSGILKKDGDGTATVGTPNNDLVKLLNLGGRIEVYDGVLITQSGGQLQDSTILCENSGILQFANTNADGRMMISGTNLCVGTGTLALSGWLDAVGDSVLKGFDETGLVIHSGTLTAMDADSLVLRVGSFSHTGGSIGGDGTIINEGGFDWRGGFISGTAFTNRSSEFRITQASAQVSQRINGQLRNEGTVQHGDAATVRFYDGSLLVNETSGRYILDNSGSLGGFDRNQSGVGIFVNRGNLTKHGVGTFSIYCQGDDCVLLRNEGGTILIEQGILTLGSNLVQTSGVTKLAGGTLSLGANHFEMLEGRLEGAGLIAGHLSNSGLVTPTTGGTISISGSYTQSANGGLEIGIGDSSERVQVGSGASLGGRLHLIRRQGFWPSQERRYRILAAASVEGQFDELLVDASLSSYQFSLEYGEDYVDVVTDSVPPGEMPDWKEDAFTPAEEADENISGLLADPDNDGVPNIWEYARGSDPKAYEEVSDGNAEIPEGGNAQDLRISFLQRRDMADVEIVIQTSADLINWDDSEELIDRQVAVVDAERERVTAKFNQPLNTLKFRAIRLQVRLTGEP